MGYFREIPNLEYQSPFSNRLSDSSYVTAKNLFRRMKIRDDLQNIFTLFNKYEIVQGARPDTVAEELYGKSSLDWVVILSAGIINLRDDWPLSDKDLYNYVEGVYGLDRNNIRHYETKEIKDVNEKLILPSGKVVDSDFTISYREISGYDEDGEPIYRVVTPTASNTVIGVTNYEYEVRKNDKKRTIYVLRTEYLQQFLTDMRNEMIYKESSQYVNDKLIRTENTRITIPQ
tara:strand:- start:411 stop:1103 length:693 start_codon:yes stop_codon:yes gene_type:complete